jgi:hypothetical protein
MFVSGITDSEYMVKSVIAGYVEVTIILTALQCCLLLGVDPESTGY